jgi:hypothetical protein
MADFSLSTISRVVADHYGEMEHPLVPGTGVTIRQYPLYERSASLLFGDQLGGKRPAPSHVEQAFHTLKNANLSPGEFEQAWSVMLPVSQRLLNREPSMFEVAKLKDAGPAEIHHHYMSHPYPGYEEVTAGDMVRYWRAAEPIARAHGQELNHEAVSRFAVAGYSHDDIHEYYRSGW